MGREGRGSCRENVARAPRDRRAGVCDRRPGRGVASAPHGACEGVSRRNAARKCRIGPARYPCGGFATDGPGEVSPRPRTVPVRGLRDEMPPESVALAPRSLCAGVSRRTGRARCRLGPAQPPCGGFATDGPGEVSPRPRTSAARGRSDRSEPIRPRETPRGRRGRAPGEPPADRAPPHARARARAPDRNRPPWERPPQARAAQGPRGRERP